MLCPEEQNKVISLDHFGPVVEKEGNTHVLLYTDYTTRYVDASAVPSTASMYYINFVTKKKWILRFGSTSRRSTQPISTILAGS